MAMVPKSSCYPAETVEQSQELLLQVNTRILPPGLCMGVVALHDPQPYRFDAGTYSDLVTGEHAKAVMTTPFWLLEFV